jgi:transcriptional regulator with XRE-family HTH domain
MVTERSLAVPERVLLRRYVARALLRRLEERGLTLDPAATALGVHRNTLQRYVSGKRPVPGEILAKLDLVDLSAVTKKKGRAA